MSGCLENRSRRQGFVFLTAPVFVILTACQPESEAPAPQVRPVRTVTVVKREVGETVSYTGRIEAENEARLAFRIAGRMIERSVSVPGGFDFRLPPKADLAGRTRGDQYSVLHPSGAGWRNRPYQTIFRAYRWLASYQSRGLALIGVAAV
jgi:hypothetical protein